MFSYFRDEWKGALSRMRGLVTVNKLKEPVPGLIRDVSNGINSSLSDDFMN